ncbi:MarR family transcriptional regulator [Hazenella sp. IB182357]|uniref:MarR family transcriptional regulator n=1 Tax=Polycladospora coralii TaxID=2771432 RepID=A0A926N6C2_9BACL|nr:MarR family transcriptional regulator [Polycladospora coralii]MBD1372724.1 MarR family transcriptional regulator [Polycladospora coralii]MBS7531115.1 MarR family transcriptional regulator [Polycladospora coralii]
MDRCHLVWKVNEWMNMNSELNRKIYLEFRQVYDEMMKKYHKITDQFGATPTQLGVLRCISKEEKQSISELVRRVGCVPSNMTTMIRRMERDGWVQITKNPQDQRESLIALTEKGKELIQLYEPILEAFVTSAYGNLTADELVLFYQLLLKVRTGLSENSASQS